MEYKGTDSFSLHVVPCSSFIENKPVKGYKATIANRDTGKAFFTMFSPTYSLLMIQATRACNDFQIDREKGIAEKESTQLGLFW